MAHSFIQRLNIGHFERPFLIEIDPENRARIERLLAEDRAKDDSPTPPNGI
jgi:hypothetical protein